MWLVDTHAHLDFPAFDSDRTALVKELADSQIAVINPATDEASNDAVSQLAAEHPYIWGALGLHPTDIDSANLQRLPSLVTAWKARMQDNPKLVAVGEIGLDYFHKKSESSSQKAALRTMLTFAREVSKPVIFHCRDAYGDLLTMLNDYPGIGGVIHCFSGTVAQAKKFTELGLSISFTAIVTYPKNAELRQAIAELDLKHIMLETDAPFLSPQEKRGQRNDPTAVRQVAAVIAEVKGLDVATVIQQTTKNAVKLFKLELP